MALLVVGSWVAGGTRATTPPTTAALAPFIASTQAPKRNAKDGAPLIYIPAGEFLMGSREGEALAEPEEKPQREVYLDGYWIYKYEVTVAQYRKFCKAKWWRRMPKAPSWGWRDDHPMVNVSWDDAAAYAKWAGVGLPTEAQWEKAARGTDGREYPWGNEWDGSKCASLLGAGLASTKPVGSYPKGVSPYGLHDMAGNVREWCADWYGESYYANAPKDNPTGPASSGYRVGLFRVSGNRVVRDDSWVAEGNPDDFRCADRSDDFPLAGDEYTGFRCALSRPDSG